MNDAIRTLRVSEAAEILAIGRSKVYELIQSGELHSIHIGRSRRIPYRAIEEFVNRRMQETSAS